MIKAIKEARVTDGVPSVLGIQPWVKALSAGLGAVHEKTIQFADRAQVYTAIDTLPEHYLDALASCWNVSWYAESLDISAKRLMLKSAMLTMRNRGTAGAVKNQVSAIDGDYAKVEEWYSYSGSPYTFRVRLGGVVTSDKLDSIYNAVEQTKNVRSSMNSILRTIEPEGPVYVGMASKQVMKVYPTDFTITDPLTGYTWYGDASETMLTLEDDEIILEG